MTNCQLNIFVRLSDRNFKINMFTMKGELFSPNSNVILVTGPTIFLFPSSLLHMAPLFQNYGNVEYSGEKAMYTTMNPVLEPSLQRNIVMWISIGMGSSFPYKAAYSIFGELH